MNYKTNNLEKNMFIHPLISDKIKDKNHEEKLQILVKIFNLVKIGFSVESSIYMI